VRLSSCRETGSSSPLSGPDGVLSDLAPVLLLEQGEPARDLVVAIAFHIGIAVFLGLIPFAALFIAAELALIEDDVYRRVASSLAAALGRCGVAQGRQVGRFLRPVGSLSGRDGG
jgi:hypothetical protein